MNFIQRMRQKPQHVKNYYALVSAVLVTSIIGSVWVVALPARFSSIANSDTEYTEEKDKKSFLSEFTDSFKGQVGAVIDAVNKETDTVAQDSNDSDALQLPPDTEMNTTISEEATSSALYTQTTNPATTTSTSSNETPKRRVILIATTTSQKSE